MILVEHIESRFLAGNLLGDPATRDVVIYVPDSHPGRRLPVVVLLHGFGTRARSWIDGPTIKQGYKRRSVESVFDGLFRDQGIAPMIVVMPDGWSGYGCSQWVDSTVNGQFERYVAEEVVTLVDDRLPTIPARESRGIMGFSSGGLGAWQLGSLRPEIFGAMALLSADSDFENSVKPLIYAFLKAVHPHGPMGPIDGDANSWLVYALAAAYTPNPTKPPYFVDLPIGYPSGEVDPELWKRWLAFDPVVNVGARVSALRSLRGILLEVGARDEFGFQFGHRVLGRLLTSNGVRFTNDEHEGDHTGRLTERVANSLRWFASVLQTTQ